MLSSRIKIVDLVEMVYQPAYIQRRWCRKGLDVYTRVINGNVVELIVGSDYNHLKVNGMWVADTGSDCTWPPHVVRLDHTILNRGRVND